MTDEFRDRLVLITGAGSGIGRATALAFAAEGARVIAVDINGSAAEATATACADRGPAAHADTVDVADWDAMQALAARVEADHGPLDVLVNNAGVGMTGRIADVTIEDWRWIRSINLDGVVHGCKAFGPAMLERRKGHVVNLSSGLGYTPTSTEPAYGATKAAVLAFSQAIRADWSRRKVGVSAICPGVINTPIIDATRFVGDLADPKARARAVKLFRRGHKPELVADAILMATRRNRAVVPVGWEARLGWYAHRLAPVAAQQLVARQSR
jgi:NAD(P)-dependent dehydrogenase (short-subunit alcohol dehydrogenase family)